MGDHAALLSVLPIVVVSSTCMSESDNSVSHIYTHEVGHTSIQYYTKMHTHTHNIHNIHMHVIMHT